MKVSDFYEFPPYNTITDLNAAPVNTTLPSVYKLNSLKVTEGGATKIPKTAIVFTIKTEKTVFDNSKTALILFDVMYSSHVGLSDSMAVLLNGVRIPYNTD